MTNKQLPNNWAVTNLRKVVSPTKGKKPIRLENSSFAESVPYIDIKASVSYTHLTLPTT